MNRQELLPEDAAMWNRSGEPEGFHTAMVHLYRGEMNRMTVWRTRLDTTSNWAILLSTGMTTFALGSPGIPHFILLLGLALIGICLFIEARRFRHLLHSKWRIHVMEAHYFSEQLWPPPSDEKASWREELAKDMERPRFTIGTFMALRMRLRSNYLLLVYFVSAVWLTKVFIHPNSAYRHLRVPHAAGCRRAVPELVRCRHGRPVRAGRHRPGHPHAQRGNGQSVDHAGAERIPIGSGSFAGATSNVHCTERDG